jgi:hypothetical protein
MMNRERLETYDQRSGLLKESLKIGVLNTIDTVDLPNEQFRVGENSELQAVFGQSKLESRNEGRVFGNIIGSDSQWLRQAGQGLTVLVNHMDAVTSRAGIASGPTVNVSHTTLPGVVLRTGGLHRLAS